MLERNHINVTDYLYHNSIYIKLYTIFIVLSIPLLFLFFLSFSMQSIDSNGSKPESASRLSSVQSFVRANEEH